MPTPDFIRQLRTSIGHDLLLLPGVAAVVRDDVGRVLMVRRNDTGAWQLPSGIIEPGEQPAEALVREVGEETGLRVRVDEIAAVAGRRRVRYTNGDECEFVTTFFRCTALGGDLVPDQDEIVEARFVDPTGPEVRAYFDERGLPLTVLDGEGVYFAQPS